MRTMKFRGNLQHASSQGSDLYELFCEGLNARALAAAAAHSSTVYTSTPLEEEEDSTENGLSPNDSNVDLEAQIVGNDRIQNVSTEVQIGSAESPSAPVPLKPTAVQRKTSDERNPPKSFGERTDPKFAVGSSEQYKETAKDPLPGDVTDGSRGCDGQSACNRNTSPVDFVDRAIAIIRRENAVVSSPSGRHTATSTLKVQSPVCSKNTRRKSANASSSKRKHIMSSQESSETDFEDANHRDRPEDAVKGMNQKSCHSPLKHVIPSREHLEPNTRKSPLSTSQVVENNPSTVKQVPPNSLAQEPHNSESSEDLLNPSVKHNPNKPRSSVSSDGIRLRLSNSGSENNSGENCHAYNQTSIQEETINNESNGAARCRPYVSPINTSHERMKNNQENTSTSGHQRGGQSPLNSSAEHLTSTNGELNAIIHPHDILNTSFRQPSRGALTSIPLIPSNSAERNVSPGSLIPAVPSGTASEKTKLLSILKDVVGYVEVRSGPDNRSRGVGAQLCALGAETVEKFCKRVTHLIFNEGSPGILKRAQEQGCHLVSVLWIDACKSSGQRVDESKYPPLNMHLYDSSNIIHKYRKVKSLQPDFDENKCEERINKHLKRIKRKAQREAIQAQEQDRNDSDSEPQSHSCTNQEMDGVRIPPGLKLKRLSVVLKRLAPNSQSSAPSTSVASNKRLRRKLMPLQHLGADCAIEEFDPGERVKHQCPYIVTKPSASKPKEVSSVRRSLRLRRSIDCESQKAGIQKRTEGRLRRRPSYESRRSSVFIPRKSKKICQVRGIPRPKNKNQRLKMRTMVCTFMHRREIDVVAAVLKQLGGWILESTVSTRTTHVVCGDAKRTVNLLRGIAHGCWILHKEWVFRSLEAGQWLDEEPYELTTFPAARQCRIEHEAVGGHPNIFGEVGTVFVAEKTAPPRDALVELLLLCGAHVTNSAREARVIVGEQKVRNRTSAVTCVKEVWVLDSIQENMMRPLREYCFDQR